LSFGAPGSYSLTLRSDNDNPLPVSFTLSASQGADALSSAITAINDQAAKTGVTAQLSEDGNSIILTNPTGADMLIADT
ncbi:flagellin hook IN motif-containing protein, partial [Klebsiella pneumoniae]